MAAPPPPRPTRPGQKQIQVVRAQYDYTAHRSDELSFKEGDILFVINKEDADWWRCRCDDKEGLVPANYVGENTAQIENPLHEAAKRGNMSFAQELLSAGVSVNTLDKAGNAPLHWAARGGHHELVSLLLTQQPALNAQNKLGDSPLHNAAWGGHVQVATQLLVAGANPEIRNNDGVTPRDLAKSDAVASLLIQHAARYTAGPDDGHIDSDDE